MTEREQFEAWAKARYAKNPHFWLRQIDDGGYSCGMADSAWDAWQAARAQPAQAVPPECDVRKIMLDVVPGIDGEGHEVYAKNVADVVKLLTEMGQRIEDLEGAQQAEAVPSDWAPTAANINALPAPVRAYIHDMVANADPAGTVRDLSISKQIIRELEASNRMLRDRLAEAVPNDVTRDAARYLWLRSKVGVSPEHERAYVWLPCGNSKINPAETDAAIDAAMAQGEKP